MLEIFSLKTAREGQFYAQAHLRKTEFIDAQGWTGPRSYDGMEFDEFDTPCAHYLLYRGSAGKILGSFRMLPTIHPYMVETLWPEWVSGSPPKTPDIWEITRTVVDQSLGREQHAFILASLFTGCWELMHHHGARQGLLFGPESYVRKRFTSDGVGCNPLGPALDLDDERHLAFVTDPVTPEDVAEWRKGPPLLELPS